MTKLAFAKKLQKAAALDMDQHNSVTGVCQKARAFKRRSG